MMVKRMIAYTPAVLGSVAGQRIAQIHVSSGQGSAVPIDCRCAGPVKCSVSGLHTGGKGMTFNQRVAESSVSDAGVIATTRCRMFRYEPNLQTREPMTLQI